MKPVTQPDNGFERRVPSSLWDTLMRVGLMALGGMASGGILGMFVGATVLALGYELFTNWVAANPESAPPAIHSLEPVQGSVV